MQYLDYLNTFLFLRFSGLFILKLIFLSYSMLLCFIISLSVFKTQVLVFAFNSVACELPNFMELKKKSAANLFWLCKVVMKTSF